MLKQSIAALAALALLPSCASNSVQNIPDNCSKRDARPANAQGSILLPPAPPATEVPASGAEQLDEPVQPASIPPENSEAGNPGIRFQNEGE